MGFPVGCTEVFFPSVLIHLFSFLGFVRNLILSLFRFLDLPEFLETDTIWPEMQTGLPVNPPASALLIRELLPVVKLSEVMAGDPPGSCAVCLYELSSGEEIRWLANCKHIFHRACLDRWMDHDQKTCPLCRTTFVPDGMEDEFNQRLWAPASLEIEYNSV